MQKVFFPLVRLSSFVSFSRFSLVSTFETLSYTQCIERMGEMGVTTFCVIDGGVTLRLYVHRFKPANEEQLEEQQLLLLLLVMMILMHSFSFEFH